MYHIRFNLLSSSAQELVKSKYGHMSSDDQFIIYDGTAVSERITVYGIYSIEQLRITKSCLFPTLVPHNRSVNAQMIADLFDSVPCYCITQMEIDTSVCKNLLVEIFNSIAIQCAHKETNVVVWKEHKGTLLFYPIIYDGTSHNGYPYMANYFAENF